jgi:putative ATP-binding cassette transporter
MKIKLIEFFSKESSSSKGIIIFYTMLSGLFAGLLIWVINNSAELIYRGDNSNIQYVFIFIIVTCAMYITKKEAFKRSITMTEKLIRKMRLRLIKRIQHADLLFLENNKDSEIYIRLTQDINILSQSIPVLIITLDSVFTIIGIFIYCAFLSIKIFLCMFLFVCLSLIVFFSRYIETRNKFEFADELENNFFESIDGLLTGFKQIKVNYKRNDHIYDDLKKDAQNAENLIGDGIINLFQVSLITDLIFFGMIGFFIFLLPLMIDIQVIVIPKLITAILFIHSPLTIIYKFAPNVVMSNMAIEKIETLEQKIEKIHAQTIQPSSHPVDFKSIELSSVSFSYKDKFNQISFSIGPLDLTINKGEVVFIAGGNGSGKSTLLKLLIGLYSTSSPGRIIIDGETLSDSTLLNYRELFSIIFTDYHLFKKLYGIETVDENQLNHWLSVMALDHKTAFVDQKFTNLNLSTGQRKRLAYIVALLEDRPVYVFDEWAADQDPEFRKYFYTTILNDLKRLGKTVIAVTHDDRYFDYADRLILMDDGKIISSK